MRSYFWSAVLTATLALGAAPAIADHYGSYAKPGYGAGKGKMPGYSHGHHRHRMGYRKGHWGQPYRSYKRPHRHRYSKGHSHGHHYSQGKAMGACQKGYHGKRYSGTASYGNPSDQSAATNMYAQKPNPATAKPAAVAAVQQAKAANIVETAIAADAFATLVSAVKAADLAETLSGEGPFTVFAPTDEAFNKLPEGTVPGLLNNTDALTKVLTYHVVPGRFDAADLIERGEFTTVNGAALRIDQLNVAKANVEASNGVIHIIDEVLLPPES